MVLDEGECLGCLSVVLDDEGRAAFNFSSLSLLVVLALAGPFTELLTSVNFDEWHVALLGQSGDELLILWILAILGEDTKLSVLSVERFADLTETLHESINGHRLLDDSLQGVSEVVSFSVHSIFF